MNYVDNRSNLTAAANPGSKLLFPGHRAEQPMHPTSLRLRLHRLGIPNLNGRTRALHDLLLQAPAPVIAEMLGYRPINAEQVSAESGTTWKRYITTRRSINRT